MIGFFPVFVAAIIWIRGLSFFNLRFLERMMLCGLAGMAVLLFVAVAGRDFGPGAGDFLGGVKGQLGAAVCVVNAFLLSAPADPS